MSTTTAVEAAKPDVDPVDTFVELDKVYFVWAESTERGPFLFDDFYEQWRDGKFPKGFLWRRGDVDTYSQPEEIEWERTRLHPPPATTATKVPKAKLTRRAYLKRVRGESQYRWLRFVVIVGAASMTICGAVIVWQMIALSGRFVPDRSDRSNYVVVVLILGVLWTSIVAALTEMALLAVDAVDIMIARGRDAAESRQAETDPDAS